MAGDTNRSERSEIQQKLGSILRTSSLPASPLPASFLKQITNDFAVENELGSFFSGKVYKGTLKDRSIIAVKKLAENSPVAFGSVFNTEVTNLMAIRHENIVELVGFCHEERSDVMSHNRRYVIVDIKDYLLCYEYLPKGSLDRHLYAKTLVIDWDTRWKIITGICHGLHFLHQRPEGPLIHMNLEPSSIWFDDNWVPKIANFGLSRIFGQEQTRMHTINVVGRIGYMAPEYLYRGEISTRSDIYSLGMIIIQITTGEINDLNSEDISGRKFIEKVHKNWWSSEDTVTSKYPSLDEYRIQQLKSCMIIGLKCVEADRNKRPSMVDIVNKLNGKQVKIFDEASVTATETRTFLS